jgi:hypothetical protein
MKFSPASRYVLLDPNILLSTLYICTLNLCFSFSVRDQVSRPYKAKDIFFYFNLKFLEGRHEDKSLNRMIANIRHI